MSIKGGEEVTQYIEERVIDIAKYVVRQKTTVRDTAKRFGVSKSTVHRDLRDRLPKINRSLYKEVDKVLNYNLAERHKRGGLSTKKKYMKEGELHIG